MAIGLNPGINLLRFPEHVGMNPTDSNGQPNQFMLIEISSSKKGTLMGSDAVAEPGPPSTEDGRQAFSDTFPKKPFQMFGGLAQVDTAVALPMPANYNVSTEIGYNANFQPSDATKFANFAMGDGSVLSKVGGAVAWKAIGSASKEGGLINNLTNLLTSGGSGDAKAQVEASQGIAQNPMKEVMFEDMDFRSYNFDYTFSPKNAAESAQLLMIISTLRYYALPELALGRLYFIFPGVFRFTFYTGDTENIWIPRIGTSVVTRIAVDYSPNGRVWSSFSTGAPVFIRLSMSIKEIEIVDRTRVDPNDNVKGRY